ncbi:class F sortase [Streptomyces otsuchiensis]|uniref:class F sortase n=1 Tax=Streptomyces otsuchiensis TaxID=2681388 RepID=UPI001D1316E3|nr:class F sortase [Streptomyces otsuchiensis]
MDTGHPRSPRPRRFRPHSGAAGALAAGVVLFLALGAPGGTAPEDFGGPPSATGRPGAEEHEQPPGAGAEDGAGAPVRVSVDRVGLTAQVVPVGVEDDGGAEVPEDPRLVGWYRFGPAPGAPAGSAVLMGHVDAHTGALGEFARLYDVREGDRVTVERDAAESVHYRITGRETVAREALPEWTFRRDGDPVLTLITCAPPYTADGGYRNNVVVTAVPEDG